MLVLLTMAAITRVRTGQSACDPSGKDYIWLFIRSAKSSHVILTWLT